MNIPAMCTGEMKYVILRIDTHVLRIDLCPRKRTRIRRQKQDEDVHLFLSERPLPGQGSWRGTRPNSPASADVPEASESVKQVVSRFPRPRKGPNKLFQGFRRLGASTDAGEAGRIPAPPRGVAPIVHTPGVSPLAMIRRPYRALPRTRPGCRPGGP